MLIGKLFFPLSAVLVLAAACLNSTLCVRNIHLHKVDVVLEITHFSQQKHLSLLSNALEEVSPDSKIALVCPDKGWLVVELNLDQIANENQLENIFKPTGIGILIKTGATRKQVMDACEGDIVKL
jgi:hypothetical protein